MKIFAVIKDFILDIHTYTQYILILFWDYFTKFTKIGLRNFIYKIYRVEGGNKINIEVTLRFV